MAVKENPPLGIGFQAATPPPARIGARWERGSPPTAVKDPPMYQPPEPSAAVANTTPATLGNGRTSSPLEMSSGTPPPVAGPTRGTPPPPDTGFPGRTNAWTPPPLTPRLASTTLPVG